MINGLHKNTTRALLIELYSRIEKNYLEYHLRHELESIQCKAREQWLIDQQSRVSKSCCLAESEDDK